ncbi:hypothetical protein LTR92_005558 [Exophiala xenobiotica]|nr:hypothetical protein LTR92_005558 [Exophiala xenobiotica]KAK5438398.1 hypothetical protein LTR18_008920 [Exophiala xenobiotica]KAK5551205.1 hypothetical protein LTR46_010791 [Exophiala xenobiotica]
MDPLSAIGLAGNILQFVDFASTLVGQGVEIYRSAVGATAVHTDLRTSIERLDALSKPFRKRVAIPRNEDEAQIVKTAVACNQIARDLATALDKLAATPHSRSSSVWKALQAVWEQPKIEETVKKLNMCKNDLHLLLSKASYDRQSFIQRSVDNLKESNELVGLKSDKMLARVQYLKDDLLDALQPLQSRAASPMTSGIMQDKLVALYAEGQEVVKAGDMLRALRFSRMTVRRERVIERHGTTLDWIYDQKHEKQALHFRDWLEKGQGYYWITGNAGSGKSTLMKFIYLDPRTKFHLEKWAHNTSASELIMADFFFWKSGAELERSQSGLLRALLYEVLRQMPEMMPEVLGRRWDEWILDQLWTDGELQSAFKIIGSQKTRSTKFCFFIDGLDEYDGLSHEIAQTVQDLSASPNIKVCVASRPWNTFEAAFGSDTKSLVRLHEHTKDDIRLYVHEMIGKHKLFQQLKAEDDRYQRVLQKIVEKAKGVFLWVFLVVRNLKETLPNEDTVEGLEQIVDDFPTELEEYFERMLDNIPRRYHEPSSSIFLSAMESDELLPLVLVAHVIPEEKQVLDSTHIHSSRKLRARLKAYCGDLMNVGEDSQSWTFMDCSERIDFLHRTVNDYLRSPSVRSKLQGRVQKDYNPSVALCESSARYLRSRPKGLLIRHPVVEILLSNASKLEEGGIPYDVGLVHETRAFLVRNGVSNRDFVKEALCRGLYSYIDERFRDMSLFDFDATYAMLYVLLEVDFRVTQRRMVPERMHARMLRVLLERGADPNAVIGDMPDIEGSFMNIRDIQAMSFMDPSRRQRSIWALEIDQLTSNTVSENAAPICETFLEYGADYDVSLGSRGTARDVLRRHFASSPGQVERFEVLARRWRRRGMVSWMPEPEPSPQNPSSRNPDTAKAGRHLDTANVSKRKSLLPNWLSGFHKSQSRPRK